MSESFDLHRFLDAQQPVMTAVRRELAAGHKTSHWMWFVFPQLRELGRSEMARCYGIASLAEARAYAAHPVLGGRLRDDTALVVQHEKKGITAIFGTPDDLKFRSCMTLFRAAVPDEAVFERALAAFFGGEDDPLTRKLLNTDGDDA